MSEIGRQSLASELPADDVWRLINTPLSGEVGAMVNPYVLIEYEELSDEHLIGPGSLAIYRPNLAALGSALGATATEMLPKDVAMRVEEYDPEERIRFDVLESEKHEGNLRYRVEATDSGSLLVIEGEVTLGSTRRLFSGMVTPYAERGLREHGQRILNNAEVLLR